MFELSTIYDYMRAYSNLLEQRILGQFPALHQVQDPLWTCIDGLLRRPFPAQAIAIMGLAKRGRTARTGMVVVDGWGRFCKLITTATAGRLGGMLNYYHRAA